MKLRANAKINLILNVVRKREDGYHDLKMVTYPVDLYDEIEIVDSLDCDSVEMIPEVEDNIIYKAIQIVKNTYLINKYVTVKVKKRIPIGYGLGGGSSDAATVIKGLNDLWQMGLNYQELADLAIQVGADVPFFINNKPAMVTGIGDIITPLPFLDAYVLLVFPPTPVLTECVFANINSKLLVEKDITPELIKIVEGDVNKIAKICFNDLLFIVSDHNLETFTVAKTLTKINSNFCMTGSGAAFFALYDNMQDVKKDRLAINKMGFKTMFAKLIE